MFALADRFPDHHFTLVGNTPVMRYEHVPPNVDLIGFVPYEELPAVYSRHTFYLQLSVWEGFPSAPCEAMLCGCVPIVSRVAALPDIVGDHGFYLEHRSVDELVSLVQRALRSDLDPLSKGARERIAQLYPKAIRRQLLDLVSGVAKG